jgi:O-antigen/teichoic acid export membrane protein
LTIAQHDIRTAKASLAHAETPDDTGALARGGRTNFLGFLMRLAARLPFLYFAGRWYGAEALGRFAYAIIIVELAAQLATFGLKRGLAQSLSRKDADPAHCVWDALLLVALASFALAALLIAFPQAMFPNSAINGVDWLLPVVIFAVAGADIALAALAYRFDVASAVRARSVIEPWTISMAAFGFAFYSLRDGLILAYVVSMLAAFIASLWPMIASYGLPRGWRPQLRRLLILAKSNAPLAAADAIEWGSRRLDLAILGLFASPAIVGIYYVAQQVASLPQKLKTSFDPILGPVITRNLESGNLANVAAQVRQVGFWIIAAQIGVALALGITGEAVLGLVGPGFVMGVAALAFLLATEAVAATAVVSESALVYIAAKRNLLISFAMIAAQILFSVTLIFFAQKMKMPPIFAAVGVAAGLMLAMALSSVLKARLLSRLLGHSVNGWRWPLAYGVAGAVVVGMVAIRLPEWMELALGIPAILGTYCLIIWVRGFGPNDRALFRSKSS